MERREAEQTIPLCQGLGMLGRVLWRVGIRSDYRRVFWRFAWPLLRTGDLEPLLHTAVIGHHLIAFTRECLRGEGESSFYAPAAVAPPAASTAAS